MHKYTYIYFAANYGEGNFGECKYNEGCETGSSPGGSLTDTGTMAIFIATIACLIIFVALLARWWRRPRKARPALPNDLHIAAQNQVPPPSSPAQPITQDFPPSLANPRPSAPDPGQDQNGPTQWPPNPPATPSPPPAR